MSDNMKDMIEFPVIYTFKAMGDNCENFINNVKAVFSDKEIHNFEEKPSRKGNYISVSATVEVTDYNELQKIYTSIKMINGLKYHL